jgi:predicted HicB family RNase H-like nuclease
MKTRLVAVRVEEELDDAIKAAAEKERRPVSQYVRNLLADAVAKSKQELAA